ncbi:PTPRD [Mytilus coruscus]|uniref:PTPRD n=1 Tax=Mytilus coruscus TaxID=42192 RepID=A0A6J8A8H5_MYTCO|nr:PTPRD [Mytilus coruscus]
MRNKSPYKLNFIPTNQPDYLTNARLLRRKPRNVFKLPDHVWEGGEEINRSGYLSKSKLDKQHSFKGVFKSKNVFKLPNNVWKTKGPTVQPKEKFTHNNFKTRSTTSSNVWKTKGPTVQPKEKFTHNNFKTRSTTSSNVWKTKGPTVQPKEKFTHNNFKTRSTTSSNVWKTKGPTVQPKEKFTHNNFKTRSTTSSNVRKTRGIIVYKNITTDKVTSHTVITMPSDNTNDGNRSNVSVRKLSQTTGETNNIGTVIGPIVAFILLLVAIIAIVLYKSKCLRKKRKGQRQTINGEIPNQNDIELQPMNRQKEPIGIDTENVSD